MSRSRAIGLVIIMIVGMALACYILYLVPAVPDWSWMDGGF